MKDRQRRSQFRESMRNTLQNPERVQVLGSLLMVGGFVLMAVSSCAGYSLAVNSNETLGLITWGVGMSGGMTAATVGLIMSKL